MTARGCVIFPYADGWKVAANSSGRLDLQTLGQTDGASQVAWKTKPLPASLDPAKPCTLGWVAGLGYRTEPSGKFTLFLGDRPLLDFNVTWKDALWRSADGKATLKYTVKSANDQDSSGVMELSLPPSLLRPGEPVELRVVGSPTRSRRWFGLYELDTVSP